MCGSLGPPRSLNVFYVVIAMFVDNAHACSAQASFVCMTDPLALVCNASAAATTHIRARRMASTTNRTRNLPRTMMTHCLGSAARSHTCTPTPWGSPCWWIPRAFLTALWRRSWSRKWSSWRRTSTPATAGRANHNTPRTASLSAYMQVRTRTARHASDVLRTWHLMSILLL